MYKTIKMDYWQFLLLVAVFEYHHQHYHNVNALSVTNIEVPEIVDFRERVTLSCSYNMGSHKLNSVKWYKDGMEFFRYSPMMHPVFITFPVDGVLISNDKYFCNEITCSIDLGHLGLRSSGAYRCEVSGDAPEFKLTSRTSNMTVAALPQHDPLINGINPTYRLDDFVVGNCSSDWSSPPATLSWYIQGEKAPSELLQPQQETSVSTNGFNLRLRSLEIRFYINQRYINSQGILRLKCVSDINQMPSLRREKVTNAFIVFKDDLTNQKLVNSSSEQRRKSSTTAAIFIDAIVFTIILRFFQKIFLINISR